MKKVYLVILFCIVGIFSFGEPSKNISGWADVILQTESHTFIEIDFVSNYKITNVTFWTYDFVEKRWMFSGFIPNSSDVFFPHYSIYTPNQSYIYWSVTNSVGKTINSEMYKHLD